VPVLPQNDNPAGFLARGAALATNQLSYVWTEQKPFAVGIPYAQTVPLIEFPKIEWLIKAGVVLIEILINVFASIPGSALVSAQTTFNRIAADFSRIKSNYESLVRSNSNRTTLDPLAQLSIQQIQTDLMSTLAQIVPLIAQISPQVNELFQDMQMA